MNENNDNKLVPKLRFPEFKDVGAWEVEEVGNIFEVTRGYVLSMNLVSDEQSESNPFPVYSSQTKNNGLAGYYRDFLYEDAITWTTDGANAGDVNFRKGKFYCTNVCGVLINKNGFSNLCVAALINSVSRKYVSYIGNPKLMNGVMSKIKIPFPKLNEQQKIAACLSSLDDVITAESKKLEVLKEHKKGLLQNLFPQEGETVPKLRFKEFENSGEWKEKYLNEISPAIFDGTHQTPSYTEKGVPFYSVENIKSGIKNKFISREDYLLSISKNKPEKGDIIITRIGDIGTSKVIDWNYEFSIYVTLAIVKKSTIFNSYYLHSFFQSSRYQKEILSKSLLNAVPCKINMDELRRTKILIPPDKGKKEQLKISEIFSSVDDLINSQSQKIETLKLHKKGLLQGLFPDVNEHNG